MDQERKNLQATSYPSRSNDKLMSSSPIFKYPSVKTKIFICAVVPATNIIYTDLTGKFPIQLSLGNKCILIVYDYNVNAIIAEPLKGQTAGMLSKSHQRVYDYLTLRDLSPRFELIDNKCSN